MSEKRRQKTEDLPLLDEINDLIEKERTLLSLQLLEQKQQADEWKAKYDSLVGKVSDNIAETADFDPLEYAAEIAEKRVDFASQTDVNVIIKNQSKSAMLNLSRVVMDTTTFTNTIKTLFGSRSTVSDFSLVNLSHCELTDEYAAALISIFRNHHVLGVDLSHNELNEVFFLQLIDVLKNRRASPQYLLLDDNLPLSAHVKHFPAIVDTLSDSLWGLTVTLEDFSSHHRSIHAAGHQHHHSKGDKESGKNPMKSFEFLSALRRLWLPEGTTEEVSSSSSSSKKKSKKAKPGRAGGGAGRPRPLQSLTVLGLKFAHLSKKSIACLEATLRLTLSSLTDLDLSFAYVGYNGADALRRILSLKDCQLIRLCLIGNAIGDQGIKLLASPLGSNKTLTFLDLRSNNLSNVGLRSIEAALTRNQTLYRFDFSNNPAISLQASTALQQLLRSYGSELQCCFSGSNHHTAPPSSAVVAVSESSVIYRNPSQVKRTMPLERVTLLYSIDFNRLNASFPEQLQQAKCIQWQWRPVQTNKQLNVMQKQQTNYSKLNNKTMKTNSNYFNTSSLTASFNGTARSAAATTTTAAIVGDDAFVFLNQFTVAYEVRVSSAMGGPTRSSIMPQSSLVTRQTICSSAFDGSNWMASRVVLSPNELPEKGTVDIFIVLLDRNDNKVISASGDCVVWEGSNLQVSSVSPQDTFTVVNTALGGENSLLYSNHLLSSSLHKELLRLGRGSVLKAVKWTTGFHNLSISLDLKLSTNNNNNNNNNSNNNSCGSSDGSHLPPQHETLGYEWFLSSFSIDGTSKLIKQGYCSGSTSEDTNSSSSGGGVLANQPLLDAWVWKRLSVDLSEAVVRPEDVLIVSGRAMSSQVKYPASLLKKCCVVMRECVMSTKLQGFKADDNNEDANNKQEENVRPNSNNDELVNVLDCSEAVYLNCVHNCSDVNLLSFPL